LQQHPSILVCESQEFFPRRINLSFQTVVDTLQVVLLRQQAVELLVSLFAQPPR
jgi:hypothetical protein